MHQAKVKCCCKVIAKLLGMLIGMAVQLEIFTPRPEIDWKESNRDVKFGSAIKGFVKNRRTSSA